VNYFFITGTSKGIGKAIAEALLSDSGNYVTGISRSCSISHKRYRHIPLDLSIHQSVIENAGKIFGTLEVPEKVVLINNAGSIGEVGYIGEIQSSSIAESLHVNMISSAVLMNEFVRHYKELKAEKIIVNISSGAGKKPVDGWGTYCASKAAMDMLSEVAATEEKIRNRGFRIFSVAPGIADTEMQEKIRNAKQIDFSTVEKFQKYKEDGMLPDPAAIAQKYIYLINNTLQFPQTILSVRDF
jgi:benzil reductase ((S)-benzoin forming)